MVTDHQKTSSELKALVDSGKVKAKLPTALDSEHQKMLDDLKAKSGKDFDQSYDQVQVKGHKDAVALFESYAKSGDDPELKSWAAKTLQVNWFCAQWAVAIRAARDRGTI
jgi:putative membrane protein